MVVVSRSRLPGVVRKGCPVPAEILFKRSADMAGVAAKSGKASINFSATRCGGVLRKDLRIPVQSALSVLRRVSERSGCVESQSVASASVSVAFESACQASEFPAYLYRVASASQSTALRSARVETPSSTFPLVLKALARRAAAAKVSRRWRRLEDASSRVLLRGVASHVSGSSSTAASKVSAFLSSSASVASGRVRTGGLSCKALRPVSHECPVSAFENAKPHLQVM